jgi:hypothetical protein
MRGLDFSKGERNGEAHRHLALAEASGEFVAHIANGARSIATLRNK